MRLLRHELLLMVLLFLVYVGAMTALALRIDLRFFLNDAVSIVFWSTLAIIGLGGALGARAGR